MLDCLAKILVGIFRRHFKSKTENAEAEKAQTDILDARARNGGESKNHFERRDYDGPFNGETLYEFFGNLVIKSHNTSDGHPVAIKFLTADYLHESEADMMAYAHSQNLLVPAVWNRCSIDSDRVAMITDFVQGRPLDQVWPTLNDKERASIKEQLAEQLKLFRSCTKPYIGRIYHQPTRSLYDGLETKFMGPFYSEAAFDEWCLSRIKNASTRRKWRKKLAKLRRKYPSKFVLTHGDLFPRNILVDNGKITGIVDWERSGFLPDYVEYALAACLYDYSGEEWWRPVLMEVLPACAPERLSFQSLIYDRGY
ncbi:hypothetical protein VTN49DRAFT_4698 [Thermomyces lanuginosus]|uniref:uncharacterized protein n=1 Tax=Thermomyces lanuginosus TaxID=5541 RepID=UPI00374395C3